MKAINRNFSGDIVRVIALLLILTYHVYALTGVTICNNSFINGIVAYGGDLGVTIFFFLSGFGIYYSVNKGGISYLKYLKKRCVRILPNYYLALFGAFILTGSAIWMSKENMYTFILHIFMVHNLNVMSHGAINGSLWTMGVIFQFYFVAYPLCKLLKSRYRAIFWFIMFASVFAMFLGNYYGMGEYAVVLGRSVPLSLNSFMVGMVTADCIEKYQVNNKKVKWFLWVVTLVFTFFYFKYGLFGGVQEFHYLQTFLTSVLVGIITWELTLVNYKDCFVTRIISFVAKYEYGIYLWHFIIITNLIVNAPIIVDMISNGKSRIYVILILISILWGACMQTLVDNSVNKMLNNK